MLDRPEVVIAATQEMIRASRAGRLPEPLPPSETAKPPAEEAFPAPDENPFKGAPFTENPDPTK
jgi:hypothetical protein